MKTAQNNRGSALLIVLVVGAALMFGVTAMFMFVPQMNRARIESRDILEYNTIVASAVEYMRYAIRERWVLTPSGAKESDPGQLPSTLEEMVTHPRALERLLISELALQHPLHGYNVRRTPPKPISDRSALLGTTTNPFTIDVDLEGMAADHPLYLVADLKRAETDLVGIRFNVSRVENVHYPGGGRGAVFLRIRAELLKRTAAARLLLRTDTIWAEGVYGYFPREINSFGLMAAGNIRLDRVGSYVGPTTTSTPPPAVPVPIGDIVIPKLSKRGDLKGGSSGMLFLSPVFANSNVVMPGAKSGWNPSTFAESVILGDGALAEPGGDWYPKSAGGEGAVSLADLSDPKGEDRLGGFRQGVRVDGERDRGLDVLFGVAPSAPPSLAAMQTCISLSKAFNDLAETQNTMLAVRESASPNTSTTPVNGEYRYRLAMTGANLFSPQGRAGVVTGILRDQENKGQNVEWKASPVVTSKSPHTHPILQVAVDFSPSGNAKNPATANVIANMSFDSKLEIQFDKPDLTSLTKAITSATLKLGSLNKSLSNKESELTKVESNLPGLQKNYDDLYDQIKSVPPPPPSDLKNDFDEAKDDYDDAKNSKNTLTAEIDTLKNTSIPDAETSLDVAKTAKTKGNKEVEFEVETKPVEINGEDQPNLVDLIIRVKDEDVLTESSLKNLVPTVFASSYNIGHDGTTTNLRSTGNDIVSNLSRIAFQRSGGRLEPPSSISGSYKTANPGGEPGGGVVGAPDEVQDRTSVYQACANPTAPPDWDQDFAPAAQVSWNFNPGAGSVRVFDAGDSTWLPVNPAAWQFPKFSRVNICEIRPGAQLVTGFYVCNRLRITGVRTTPLRIIGTFLVGQLEIDPSAVQHGITWSSIFHPNAIQELRQTNRIGKGKPCGNLASPNFAMNLPIWHPSPSLQDLVTLYACMPTAVRGQFPEPFTWTEVTPVCGPVGSGMSCTYRDKKFTVLTMSYVNSL